MSRTPVTAQAKGLMGCRKNRIPLWANSLHTTRKAVKRPSGMPFGEPAEKMVKAAKAAKAAKPRRRPRLRSRRRP
ncbi:hypothetical protein NKH18_23530 [Streptomyces sp. M10(2022)]